MHPEVSARFLASCLSVCLNSNLGAWYCCFSLATCIRCGRVVVNTDMYVAAPTAVTSVQNEIDDYRDCISIIISYFISHC